MGQYSNVIFIIAIVAVFYFLIIKPQQSRQKQQAETMRTLAPGVEIVTIGGIYGTIVAVEDERVRISVADGTELEVAKRAIGQIVPVTAVEVAETDADDADGADGGADGDDPVSVDGSADAGTDSKVDAS